MKKLLLICSLLFSQVGIANDFLCTADQAAKIIFQTHPSSQTPELEDIADNGSAASMMDKSTIVTGPNKTKNVWVWNVYRKGSKIQMSKLKVVFNDTDKEIYKVVSAVIFNCDGSIVENEANADSKWMVLSTNSPAHKAREMIYQSGKIRL